MAGRLLAVAAPAAWAVALAAILCWGAEHTLLRAAPLAAWAALPAACAAARWWPGAAAAAAAGAAAGLGAWARLRRAEAAHIPDEVAGTLAGPPRLVGGGDTALLRVRLEGYPAPLPVFAEAAPGVEGLAPGTPVGAVVDARPAERPGIARHVATAAEWSAGEPAGPAALAAWVRGRLRGAVERAVGERSQGLIPGVVLGDTSLQDAAEQQAYVDSGLSHLSAVSGANIALVAGCAAALAPLCGVGPKAGAFVSLAVLACYVAVVGAEPSVLRAAASGVVGLVAVLRGGRAAPLTALGVAVLALVLVDPDLACQWGFALSVAATLGIVALSPPLASALRAGTGWPPVCCRAMAVALAADVATAPLISAMTGRVSLVAVGANLLAGPAVAPVTVVGLLAALAASVPGLGALAAGLLLIAEPAAFWVATVARVAAGLPGAGVEVAPGVVAVAYGWLLFLVLCGRAGWAAGAVVLGAAALAAHAHLAGPGPAVPWGELELVAVPADTQGLDAALEEAAAAHPGADGFVVTGAGGRPRDRPTVLPDGRPVFFPERDGEVRLHRDGTQRAADGRF